MIGSSPLTRGIQVIDALDSDIGRFIHKNNYKILAFKFVQL